MAPPDRAGSARRTLRVGIDVGGTFTDVVAVDVATSAIVARIKTPTTHSAPEGVARGIVDGLNALLAAGIDPAEIAFIAHSTTQATNALLEGDVAKVGIVGLHGRFDPLGRRHVRVPPVPLGDGARFAPAWTHARLGDDASLARALDALRALGVESIAVSQAFSVDDPRAERGAAGRARDAGFFATAGHEVSQMYGLRARTRTAALNAAILPTMVRTARSTAEAVERAGVGVPLMIMRSDGGVMDVREVMRRPILTMLSGPAAGIAGALLHENVSDGIFIEVGGTSADCSVIRRGLPQMRPARVGGHRTMLRTLDVRTLAIAGGSLVRLDLHARGASALRDVGPRSAHIAGYAYAAFTPRAALAGARVVAVSPLPGDPDDYVALELPDGRRCAPTPTCAANLLGYVPAEAFARGDSESARIAFDLAGAAVGCEASTLARAVLERAVRKVRAAIDELVDDYALDRGTLELIGGGGGAAALVPATGEMLGIPHRLARDAEVISPLGVALALVRDVVERTIVNPSADDVVRVRRDALERVVAAGAAPELVEIVVEIDARRNLVRATASGATAAAASGDAPLRAGEAEREAAAERALRRSRPFERTPAGSELAVYSAAAKRGGRDVCIVDLRGIVRATRRDALLRTTPVAEVRRALDRLLEDATTFGDVGRALPEVTLVYRNRVADLGTLAEAGHVLALAEEELRGLPGETTVVMLAARRAV
jgi:N-methylhydantoinase A/oxoprolinase/acetone carboxylase beta subunit